MRSVLFASLVLIYGCPSKDTAAPETPAVEAAPEAAPEEVASEEKPEEVEEQPAPE